MAATSLPVLPGTVEHWAHAYIRSTDLAHKSAPSSPPRIWEECPPERNVGPPERAAPLEASRRRPRAVKPDGLRDPAQRAKLCHKFWHHELQAAELMCWGILRFPETPREFRTGLLRLCLDEIRHMNLYRHHVESLGFGIGDFPVRDWFWERVPTCTSPVQFVALLGMGLEAANLEHTPRFAAWFRTAGDDAGAAIQEQVGREEEAHVRFAARWFGEWMGTTDFDVWRANLPAPLSPLLLRGKTINRAGRLRAGLSDDFVTRLEAWRP